MKEYLIRLAQVHTSFRKAELEALSEVTGVSIEIVEYSEESPYCILRIADDQAARKFISRAILSISIYELWGIGTTYDELHSSIRTRTSSRWPDYSTVSFRFTVDCYQGKRSTSSQKALIESFSYLDFRGPIVMKNPDEEFTILESYGKPPAQLPIKERKGAAEPNRLFFGRLVGATSRDQTNVYDLKKRRYISTTSMDAELALVTANIALAAPGKMFFDPFMGTGGFPLAVAHFGAHCMGSDIDGRAIRGKGPEKNVVANFRQYGIQDKYLDGFVSDLTNCPLRVDKKESRIGILDGIVCDPPYGVREGLKVLGRRDGEGKEPVILKDGTLAHLQEGYIAPKRPYSFEAMLDDILEFAATMLTENGRLSMWMPTANDEDIELAIPMHDWLELVSVCVQPFNKWSRRLLTYRRRPESEIDRSVERKKREYGSGKYADELNKFRKKFFEGFKEQQGEADTPKQSEGAKAEGV